MPFERASAFAKKRTLSAGAATWHVASGEVMFVVDDATGTIKAVSDLGREDRIRKGLGRTYIQQITTVQQAWSRANQLVESIGLSGHGFKAWRARLTPDSLQGDVERKGRAFLDYQVRPFGYDSFGNGNNLSIVLDVQDGAVVSFQCNLGWNYDPASNIISQATAISKARIVAEQYVPQHANAPANAVLQYAVSDGGFGSPRGTQLRRDKRVRLSYCVTLGGAFVKIDAVTGECLGGSLLARKTRARPH